MLATAHLFQENQQLKAVIYRLELENYALKGISVDMVDMPEVPTKGTPRNWLPGSQQQSSLPTLAPIQIRPSPSTTGSPSMSHPVPILPQQKKAKLSPKNELAAKKNSTLLSKGQNVDSNQQFTFSISTPDTLRASVNNTNSQNCETIQMVPLYPDHSHPANQHFENKAKSVGTITPILSPVTASSPVSVASCRSDSYSVGSEMAFKKDDESTLDTLLFGNSTEDNKFGSLLEPLFNTSEEFDISSLISNQPMF
jgi:hypothetical protein